MVKVRNQRLLVGEHSVSQKSSANEDAVCLRVRSDQKGQSAGVSR